MTAAAFERMNHARAILQRFASAGRPAGAKPPSVAALQQSPVGWPVARDDLVTQIDARLRGTSMPRQLATSYCGPAAFLYCILKDRPDIYVSYAVALWETGHYTFRTGVGHVEVESADRTKASLAAITGRRRGKEQISDLDWMTMAALSASTRPLSALRRGAGPDDVGLSITYPWVLKQWFQAGGSRPQVDSMGLGALKSGLFMFANLMRFWRSHWLVIQIDSSLVTTGAPNTFEQRHWVVVNPNFQPRVRREGQGPWIAMGDIMPDFWKVPQEQAVRAMEGAHLADWPMELSLVTWGKEDFRARMTRLGDIPARFYGGYAFPHFR
ncbi:hypothetical protein [Sphingomonas sanguinis]|uniref:Uncharacterized protein n=1 Tax=Sphingomonas sanguinis TaxID=33051 RepID=A0A147JD16_9SPHN|nr:hypothetical protein [Sphingomonas sanguinis]KTW17715.1 hypothetical protein NS258_01615 [Sphingomonas sanguinis]